MKFDQFVGQVQVRARFGTLSDTMGAIRATLETLGERISPDEAKDLASQLPREIGYFLFRGAISLSSRRFGFREFVERVAFRECVRPSVAAYHARVVMEVVSEAVSLGEMEDVVQQLPAEFEPLFAGSTGSVREYQPRGADERMGVMDEEEQEQEPPLETAESQARPRAQRRSSPRGTDQAAARSKRQTSSRAASSKKESAGASS